MKYGMTTDDFDAIMEERGCDCARPRDRLVDDEGNPLPPRYKDLAAGDKGLLWLAHHEGRVIQYWHEADWMDPEWYWEDDDEFDPTACRAFSKLRYRVKPKPRPELEVEVDNEGNPLPPPYYDLDDEDHGLLWLAHRGNRRVQAWNNLERRWEDKEDDVFFSLVRYRVKPESEVDDEGNPLPPVHQDLGDGDQVLLWLAHQGNWRIQAWNDLDRRWEDDEEDGVFFSQMRYRVKPEPETDVDDEGNPLPPAYRDLASEDKNRLWNADDLGLGIQFWDYHARRWIEDEDFDPNACRAFSKLRYRVKPEGTTFAAPARLPVQIQGPGAKVIGTGTMIYRDGAWDFDSLEVDDQPTTN